MPPDATTDPAAVEHREIPGYPLYRAGSDGSIWSKHDRAGNRTNIWRQLSPGRAKGYLYVDIRREGEPRRRAYVHHLVLETFVGPRPPGTEACHFPDSNPVNNSLANLRWDTRLANREDSRVSGTLAKGDRIWNAKLDESKVVEIFRLRRSGLTQKEIGRRLGVGRLTVQETLSRKRWKHVVIPEEVAG